MSWEDIAKQLQTSKGAARSAYRRFQDKDKEQPIVEYCLNCGQGLINRNHKFCSLQCQHNFQYKEFIYNWKCGKEKGLKGKYGMSNYLRRYLFEKYDNHCSKCGWSKINPHTKKIPLEVEHIDGDYTNNSEDNLTVLCPNCHSLTATYKGA